MLNAPQDPQVVAYIGKWTAKYEAATREYNVLKLAFNDKDYPGAVKAGIPALASDPDNLKILFAVALSAYAEQNSNSATPVSFASDRTVGSAAALHGISLIKGGRPVPSEPPFNGEEQTLAQLNFYAGSLKTTDQPEQAIVLLTEAVQHKSYLSGKPEPYLVLLQAYNNRYRSEKSTYDGRFAGKPESAESAEALERVNALVDRMLDCYARALAYAPRESQYKEKRSNWLDRATELYKFRHAGSDAGLNAFLSGAAEKPVPSPPAFVLEASATGQK